jgi:signal transduction histidine kinase
MTRMDTTGATILVVEDEHLVALDIQQCLERMRYEPVVVYSGEAAVFTVEQMAVDLVLMDIKLGGPLDGIDTASAIRARHDVPIIYLTAYADPATLDRARVTEPYGYVLKPFQERELTATIEMALHRHSEEHRRAEHDAIQRFLADASAKLAASLDFREVAHDAANLLVPRFADWFAVHLRASHETIPAFTWTHPNGEHPTPPTPRLLEDVEQTGRAQTLELNGGSPIETLGVENVEALRRVGARNVIGVPLVARGQMLGAIALGFARTRDRSEAIEPPFMQDFGQRLGLALDNALLYRSSQQAIAQRDDILAIVSHDLRAPLATILLHAENLEEQPTTRKPGEAIRLAAQLMNRLIGDLLDASAINAGQLALEWGVHEIRDVIAEAVEMFRRQAATREIGLEYTLGDARVRCDRDRIVQVLTNLIANALKFTPRGGAVRIEVVRRAGEIELAVEDTGTGIPADQLPMLFERFGRAHAHRGGVGLGLFIARGIIAAHGGTIGVVTAVGKGTRFSFALPEAA